MVKKKINKTNLGHCGMIYTLIVVLCYVKYVRQWRQTGKGESNSTIYKQGLHTLKIKYLSL